MPGSKSVPLEPRATNPNQLHFGFGAARRLDKLGFANILTPTKEIRVASLARRGFVKAELSQAQFFLRDANSLNLPADLQNMRGRMGAVAPKRLLKRAVLRNRAKRIMRETARQHALITEPTDVIVFLRSKAPLKNKAGRKQFARDIKAVLDRTLDAAQSAKKRLQRSANVSALVQATPATNVEGRPT